MEIELRCAEANDYQAVSTILIESRKAFLPYAPSPHADHDVQQWVINFLIPSGGVTVAHSHNEIIGILAVSREDKISWIDQLYIAPEYVNLGVGTALLQHALSRLAGPIQLYTFQENTRARRFYERNGFQAIKFTDGAENEERCPDVLYQLSDSVKKDRPGCITRLVKS